MSCSLCDSQKFTSMAQAFCHHLSEKNGERVWERNHATQSTRKLHQDIGFPVQELMDASAHEEERRIENFTKQWEAMPADKDWIKVDFRHLIGWKGPKDATTIHQTIRKAPCMDDMLARCEINPDPRSVQIPTEFPFYIPQSSERNVRRLACLKGRHLYPFSPGSRLGMAALVKLSMNPVNFDIVCGSTFLHALRGHTYSQRRNTWYLQKLKNGPICALHIPIANYEEDDIGHKVERLIAPCPKNATGLASVNGLTIGGRRVLVTCQIDAVDDEGNWMEIKTTATKLHKPSARLQVAFNGCHSVLVCNLNADKSAIQSVYKVATSDILASVDNVLQGQKLQLGLKRLLDHALLADEPNSWVGPVLKLTFDAEGLPALQLARGNVQVVPQGWSLYHHQLE